MEVRDLKTVEDAREFFQSDVFATTVAGCYIEEARPGYSRCSMEIGPEHKNAANTVMGGAIYTLADFAFAVAANMMGRLTVSLTSQISFLGTSRGNRLTAEAVMIKSGKNTCYYRVTVTDDTDRVIAEAVTNGFIKNT